MFDFKIEELSRLTSAAYNGGPIVVLLQVLLKAWKNIHTYSFIKKVDLRNFDQMTYAK